MPLGGVCRELFETAELAEAESPGAFADAVPVDNNIRAWTWLAKGVGSQRIALNLPACLPPKCLVHIKPILENLVCYRMRFLGDPYL